MTVRSTYRGKPTVYNQERQRWECADQTDEPARCSACQPTPEGHDPCIANIPGAIAACCGHGAANPTVTFPDCATLLNTCGII